MASEETKIQASIDEFKRQKRLNRLSDQRDRLKKLVASARSAHLAYSSDCGNGGQTVEITVNRRDRAFKAGLDN